MGQKSSTKRGQNEVSKRNLAPRFEPGQSGHVGKQHTAVARARISQALRYRGEAERLARQRLKEERVQRRVQHEAQSLAVLDAYEMLRKAEPEAAARLIELLHVNNDSVRLAAVRELFDRTRGRPAQRIESSGAAAQITIHTGISTVTLDVPANHPALNMARLPAAAAPEALPEDQLTHSPQLPSPDAS
jgi:hypothetical protein